MKATIAKLMCVLLVGATIMSSVEAGFWKADVLMQSSVLRIADKPHAFWKDDIAKQASIKLITDGTDTFKDINSDVQSNYLSRVLKSSKNLYHDLLNIRKHDEDRFDWHVTKMIGGYALSAYCMGMGLAHLLRSLNVYKAGCLFVAGYAALRVSANGYKKFKNFARQANLIIAERTEREAKCKKHEEILKKQKEDQKKYDIDQLD